VAGLILEVDGARHQLIAGSPYYLISDGRGLSLDRRAGQPGEIGYFLSGMSDSWYFWTEDVADARDLRIGRNAISEQITTIRPPFAQVSLARLLPAPVKPEWRAGTRAALVSVVGVTVSVWGNIMAGKMQDAWFIADKWVVAVVFLALTVGATYLAWRWERIVNS
jgi:hypothetical protein